MIKKTLPDLIAILAFILISFAYFFPAEAPYDVAVLFVHLTGEAVQHLLHGGVAGAGLGEIGRAHV